MVNNSINLESLPYRNGVGVVLLNKENKVFVAKRIDNPNNFWQMPQGGKDKNENNLDAALRELSEETSIKNVSILKEIDGTITYNLPKNLLGIIWKGKFKGQIQKWFIMKFNGKDDEINLKTENPEFIEWKWLEIEKITDNVVDFKKEVYVKLRDEVKKFIINLK